MDFDTFYTVQYRNVFVHARHNRTLKREEFTIHGCPSVVLLSLQSAKRRITERLRLTKANKATLGKP